MKHCRNRLFAVVVALLASGCSHVTSTAHADKNVMDEFWYVRSKTFLGMTVSSTIMYCGPAEKGTTVCRKARIEGAPAPETTPAAGPETNRAAPSPDDKTAPRCRASDLPQWKDADAVYKKKLLDYCRTPVGSPDPGMPSP